MDLLRTMFEQMNEEHWGIPPARQHAARRRREPRPQPLVAAGKAMRTILRAALTLGGGTLAGARGRTNEADEAPLGRGAKDAAGPDRSFSVLHVAGRTEGRIGGNRLDRAA